MVNAIRPRVKAWREAGWPGASAVTRRLLRYWNDPEEFETRRFFFCQIEAVETLIRLAEAPAAERTGVEVPSDGGGFERVCAKMATGAGKTVVMAMVVVWQVLNKVAHPRDRRFSRNVLVVAPGLTVKSRLAVLEPSLPGELLRGVPRRALRDAGPAWAAAGFETPPVMITVANRGTGVGAGAEIGGEAGSATGAQTGARPRKLNAKQRAELLRRQVDTVGRPGQPGGGIRIPSPLTTCPTVESFPIRRRVSRKIGLCSGAACFWWRGNRSGTIESTTGQRVSGPGTAAIQPVQGPRSGTGMDR